MTQYPLWTFFWLSFSLIFDKAYFTIPCNDTRSWPLIFCSFAKDSNLSARSQMMLEDRSVRVNDSLNRRIRMTSYLDLDWICRERVLVSHALCGTTASGEVSYRLSTRAVIRRYPARIYFTSTVQYLFSPHNTVNPKTKTYATSLT